jgi:hypothetical protein
MVGDFEKNSLGLVWLAALLWSIHIWLNDPTPRHATKVVVFWGLAGITHIAVFGASLLFGGLAILFYFAGHRGRTWRILWPLLLSVCAVCLLAAALVLWKFDAQRIMRLANALAHPSDFLSGNNMPRFGPGGTGGAFNPFMLMEYAPSLPFAAVSIIALIVCWQKRGILPPGEVCVVGACAVGVLFMTGPWVHGDKTFRFYLIAIVPAVLAGAFAAQHWQRPRLRAVVMALAMLGMIGPAFIVGGQPVVSEEGVRELRSLAPLIQNPERTLIVARHGVEWWTAWTLHTHIAHGNSLQTADWQNFDAVFFLRSKQDGFPGPGGGPPHGMLSGIFQPGPPPGGAGMPGGMQPPPGNPPFPGGGPGGSGNPMAEPEIPADSKRVHDGAKFILARVFAPPPYLSGTQSGKQ